MFSEKFIAATQEYCTHEKMIPAPLFRKRFSLEKLPEKATFTICGLGFYRLFLNGKEITNGYLAPFHANPDQLLYYDVYDVKENLREGENVIGIMLGNGFVNSIGGYIWEFDKTAYRSAPKTAFALETESGVLFEADESVKTHPSPILFDDLREGEWYDARLEIADWADLSYNDSAWGNAIPATTPLGEKSVSSAPPLKVMETLTVKKVSKYKDGYIFDFGENTSGFLRTTLKNANAGQKLTFVYFERLGDDNGVYMDNISFSGGRTRKGFNQQIEYVCKDGAQTYEPSFVWCGYRYVYIKGLTEKQAEEIQVLALGIRSQVELRGGFSCSDARVNRLCEMILRSDLTNLFHFPVDCPHREKNGWTADAALSAEQEILQMNIEDVHKEWLKSIRAAQVENGALPGIVPTGGWGFAWGNGPAWDCVLFWLPYYAYQFRGQTQMIEESVDAMMKYLQYAESCRNQDGLIAIGLGDWCQALIYDNAAFETPLEITDSLVVYDICQKAGVMFRAIGQTEKAEYAEKLGGEIAAAFRKKWVRGGSVENAEEIKRLNESGFMNKQGWPVKDKTQTAQCMALCFGMIEEENKRAAVEELVRRIERDGNRFNVGVVGAHSFFNVLAENGCADLAFRLIMQSEGPSYGYLVDRGETTLWESMYDFGKSKSNVILKNGRGIDSLNHHFWGFVYVYFVRYVAGLRYNPDASDVNYAEVCPVYTQGLSYAETSYDAPAGKLFVRWDKTEKGITLKVCVPKGMRVKISYQGQEEVVQAGVFEKTYNE